MSENWQENRLHFMTWDQNRQATWNDSHEITGLFSYVVEYPAASVPDTAATGCLLASALGILYGMRRRILSR